MKIDEYVNEGLIHIGKVIKKNRKRARLSQEDLAEFIGCKGATISRYENNKSDINASAMLKISYKCGFDPIEYVLKDKESFMERFYTLVSADGKVVNRFKMDVFHDMSYTAVKYTDPVDAYYQHLKKLSDKELLVSVPPVFNESLSKADIERFEEYMQQPENSNKLRLLLYGYKLVSLYDFMDTPYEQTEKLADNIIVRLIKSPSGEIDEEIHKMYLKCLLTKIGSNNGYSTYAF